MASRSVVILDGDDTLWATEPLYDLARQRIRDLLCATGVDGVRWERVEREIDLDRVATQGFVWHRFPRSCLQALREVEPHRTAWRRWAIAIPIFLLALRVYLDRPTLMPDAEEILRDARRDNDLVLMTKGQHWIQWRRIRQSGLRRYFERCIVVEDKTAETFVRAAPFAGRPAISVGNSLASDIAPALIAGFSGVHIDGYMWEHERREPSTTVERVTTVPDLRGALEAIRHISELDRLRLSE